MAIKHAENHITTDPINDYNDISLSPPSNGEFTKIK